MSKEDESLTVAKLVTKKDWDTVQNPAKTNQEHVTPNCIDSLRPYTHRDGTAHVRLWHGDGEDSKLAIGLAWAEALRAVMQLTPDMAQLIQHLPCLEEWADILEYDGMAQLGFRYHKEWNNVDTKPCTMLNAEDTTSTESQESQCNVLYTQAVGPLNVAVSEALQDRRLELNDVEKKRIDKCAKDTLLFLGNDVCGPRWGLSPWVWNQKHQEEDQRGQLALHLWRKAWNHQLMKIAERKARYQFEDRCYGMVKDTPWSLGVDQLRHWAHTLNRLNSLTFGPKPKHDVLAQTICAQHIDTTPERGIISDTPKKTATQSDKASKMNTEDNRSIERREVLDEYTLPQMEVEKRLEDGHTNGPEPGDILRTVCEPTSLGTHPKLGAASASFGGFSPVVDRHRQARTEPVDSILAGFHPAYPQLRIEMTMLTGLHYVEQPFRRTMHSIKLLPKGRRVSDLQALGHKAAILVEVLRSLARHGANYHKFFYIRGHEAQFNKLCAMGIIVEVTRNLSEVYERFNEHVCIKGQLIVHANVDAQGRDRVGNWIKEPRTQRINRNYDMTAMLSDHSTQPGPQGDVDLGACEQNVSNSIAAASYNDLLQSWLNEK